MKPDRAWMRLGSGRRLDLLDPQPDQLEDRDIAVLDFAHSHRSELVAAVRHCA